ncbi:LSU ribosomal protein L15p (L27Ae) [hydrothermal vent metagenome]|uniref:LSU ribosomal protein L15p (L27Ae) n=1 Tax=hydrothermal vent metagenome TaxID=652676 RepID=A0A3B0UFY7_9ZZZZ
MQLNTLKSNRTTRNVQRVGRGGTRGKTSGRGMKGQKSRAGHSIRPEMRDIIKKLPKRRGYGKNRSRTVRIDRKPFAVVNLKAIEESFSAGDTVTSESLLEKGVIRTLRGTKGVKVLGTGTISKKVTISGCSVSASATKAIEAVGGAIIHV